jgi:hypothetical protein
VPTQDGASGLHYGGQLYVNQARQLSSDICNGASASIDQIADVMPNSISTTTLTTDKDTGRISASALQGYISTLEAKGVIPGSQGSLDDQMRADKQFYAAIQEEYCFYESRYKAALAQFLALVASPTGTDQNAATPMLNATIGLNQRLNSLLEIIAYVGNERARRVNARSAQLDTANASLDDKITTLQRQYDFLTSSDVRVRTQSEMIRYSAEKSRGLNIQIMFFVALNVVALGTVITVYRSVGGAPGM